MSETIQKEISASESDPLAIDDRKNDAPGSFLDVYRSVSVEHVQIDEHFVDKSVHEGVIPESVRYGVMRRGDMEAYRGVVKGHDGAMYYFNWAPDKEFKLVKADTDNKKWDATRFYKSCSYGCDLIKGPIDPGEAVEDEDEDDTEKASGKLAEVAAVAPVNEDDWREQQERMMHEVHPGAAGSHTPDDPTVGRNWHEPIVRATDGMNELAAGDGDHWKATDLMKAWGQRLQETAPRVMPKHSTMEATYLKEVLGATDQQIQKGLRLPPRHRVAFDQWKSSKLRGQIGGLESWLGKYR